MFRIRRACIGLLPAALLLAGWGCGQSSKLHKVEGIVTLDGKAVDGALVQFIATDAEGRQATGQTGSDGVFHLTTFTTGDGAQAGVYTITVTVTEPVDMGGFTPDPNDPSAAMKKYREKALAKKLSGKPKLEIPARYMDPKNSGLKATVPTEGQVKLALRSTGGS